MRGWPWALCALSLLLPRLAAGEEAKETAAQAEFRRAYIESTEHRIHAIADANGKARTPEESAQIGHHWARAMKAIRIREVAQDVGDTVYVGKVDAFLARLDAAFYDTLTELAAEAPLRPRAPTIVEPASSATFRVDQPFECRVAEYPGARARICGLRENGRVVWYGCGGTGECRINAAFWRFASPGPAQIVGRVPVDRVWSNVAEVPIRLAASDAAPAPTLEEPRTGEALPLGKLLTFHFADYPNAAWYACSVRQGGATVSTNAKKPNECGFELNSVTSQPFHQGLATVDAFVFTTDGKGSRHVWSDVELVGNDAQLSAPKFQQPVAGQQVAPGQSVTCSFADYPGATRFDCFIPDSGDECVAVPPTRSCVMVVGNHNERRALAAGPQVVRASAFVDRWSPYAQTSITLTTTIPPAAPPGGPPVPPSVLGKGGSR